MGQTVNYPYNGHWHKSDSAICYAGQGRFTNAKAATTFSTYPGGGYLVAVAPQNNDVIYTKVGNGATTVIRKSTNKGAAFSDFVTPGWDPTAVDNRRTIITVDPGDHSTIYMPGPLVGFNRDMRRYNGSTWKSDYNLATRFRSDNPDYPSGMYAYVNSIAVDPQDRDTIAVSIRAPSFCEVYITYNATDATPTWERITKNMPRLAPAGLKFHPTNGDLWAGFIGGGSLVYPHPDAHPDPTWTTNLIVQNVEPA
jgi:hypothetical protein